MDIKELKSGDVLLFSPEKNSWISDAIVWITGAPVSHAAMTYKESSTIIEETVPNVRIAPAEERFKQRLIHVMRFNQPVDNFDPVMDNATTYLNDLEPYGMSDLYLAGMVLLYKKISPDSLRKRLIVEILKSLAEELSDLINKHKFPGKKPMVCSQFVFLCYKEAGDKFKLSIDSSINKGKLLATDDTGTNLLDLAKNHQTSTLLGSNNVKSALDINSEQWQPLVDELKNNDKPEVSMDEILDSVHQVTQAIHAIEQNLEYHKADAVKGIQILENQASMFVTPADLLEHCPQLNKVGEISI